MRQTLVLRMVVVTAVAALLVALVPTPAEAHHRPNLYCSDSGDLCQSTRKIEGVRKLRIVLATRYFSTFHLCVYGHREDYEWCAPYRLRQGDDGTWGRSVGWFKEWPRMPARGAFTVSWWVGDQRIGRILGFHIR